MNFDFIAKVEYGRLFMLLAVGVGAFEAFLYAQAGDVGRIDDSIVGGIVLAFSMVLFTVIPEADGVGVLTILVLAFLQLICGLSLLMGNGFWPWAWPISLFQ